MVTKSYMIVIIDAAAKTILVVVQNSQNTSAVPTLECDIFGEAHLNSYHPDVGMIWEQRFEKAIFS